MMAAHSITNTTFQCQLINTGPALDRLPEEIIQEIIKKLGDDVEGFNNLRLTCRSLEYSTHDKFLNNVFRKGDYENDFGILCIGHIKVGTKDLGNWAVAMKRPQISEYFEILYIHPDPRSDMKAVAQHLKERKYRDDVEELATLFGNLTLRSHPNSIKEAAHRLKEKNYDEDAEVLAAIFSSMKNLRMIVLRCLFSIWEKDKLNIGVNDALSDTKAVQAERVSHTMFMILSALSKIPMRQLSRISFGTAGVNRDTWAPEIWTLEHPPNTLRALRQCGFHGLSSIDLCLSNRSGDAPMNWTQDRAANALIKFLAAIPCLEYLILAIAPDSVFGPRVVKRFLQEYHNPNLFYFQFDDFIVPDSKDLLNFFEKHKSTLRAVILRKIHLCDNGWKVLFQKMCEELHLGNIMLDGLFVLQQNAYWSVIFPWCEYGFMSCPGASGFNERQEEEVTDELRRAADEYQSTETRYEDDNFIDRMRRGTTTRSMISMKSLRYVHEVLGWAPTAGDLLN